MIIHHHPPIRLSIICCINIPSIFSPNMNIRIISDDDTIEMFQRSSGPMQNVYIPAEQFDLTVPYARRIEGFTAPKKIRIVAVPSSGFQVNLKSDQGETLFHFNPRFNENAVVRNSTNFGGKWQKEERHGGFPFQQGKLFTLVFEATNDGIKIKVNGNDFVEFERRDNLRNVDQLDIHGDLEQLHSVSVFEQ